MAVDIGADERAGATTTNVSAAAVAIGVPKVLLLVGKLIDADAVGVAKETKLVGKIIERAEAHGSPAVTVAAIYSIIANAVAVGVANATNALVSLIEAAATAVGVVKVTLAVSKIIAATAVGVVKETKRVSPAAFAATGTGVAKQTLQAQLGAACTAVGSPTCDEATTQGRTGAAVAVGVAGVTVTFVPFTPPAADPAPTDKAEDRTVLVRLGKWLWG